MPEEGPAPPILENIVIRDDVSRGTTVSTMPEPVLRGVSWDARTDSYRISFSIGDHIASVSVPRTAIEDGCYDAPPVQPSPHIVRYRLSDGSEPARRERRRRALQLLYYIIDVLSHDTGVHSHHRVDVGTSMTFSSRHRVASVCEMYEDGTLLEIPINEWPLWCRSPEERMPVQGRLGTPREWSDGTWLRNGVPRQRPRFNHMPSLETPGDGMEPEDL